MVISYELFWENNTDVIMMPTHTMENLGYSDVAFAALILGINFLIASCSFMGDKMLLQAYEQWVQLIRMWCNVTRTQ